MTITLRLRPEGVKSVDSCGLQPGQTPHSSADLLQAIEDTEPTTIDWLKTARNLVKFGGGDKRYKDVEKYLRAAIRPR